MLHRAGYDANDTTSHPSASSATPVIHERSNLPDGPMSFTRPLRLISNDITYETDPI